MKKETLVLGGIGFFTVLLLIGAAVLLGKDKSEPTETKPVDTTKIAGEKRHAVGSESAKVTIVEFADFQCPACATAYPTVKQIIGNYQDQIEYVYRHFPLPMHQNARIAAKAAESAGVQGKFFEMHDLLYENQKEWSESRNPQEIFVGYAKKLGLDTDKFTKDLDEEKLAQAIQDDQNAGMELGVNSTPTFYINGVKQAGVLSYDTFKKLIDAELKK